MSAAREPVIEIRDLSLRAQGRVLLEDASLIVGRGEVVLLVGLSGSGKSLTLNLLLGLLDRRGPGLEVDGEVRLFGEEATADNRRRVGIVFQDFGLLDEWSARENVRFGADHGSSAAPNGAAEKRVDGLMSELGLGHAGRVATLSGGMKQRTALARTLAYDADVICYDEPTSGLDPSLAAQVAARIRTANDVHGKTSLVVTHDLASLAPIADRIVVLDPELKRFREIAKDAVREELDRLAALPAAEPNRQRETPGVLRRVADFFEATGRCVEAAAAAVIALVPRWPRLRWGAAYLWYYLRLAALGSALVYVGLAGFILGVVVTYFTFSFFPYKEFTEPVLIEKIVAAIGYALYRIMVPGMVAMLVAARSGAAVAADIGNRTWSRQIDALRSLGVPPHRYLLGNVLLAHLLAVPLLVAVNFAAASLASLATFAAIRPDYSTWFWQVEYTRLLRGDGTLYLGTWWLLGKSAVSFLGVGAIATFQGLRPMRSSRDVSAAVTRTIIWATLFVLTVQMISAFLEFDPI